MEILDSKIIFKNDKELEAFAINPSLVINSTGEGFYYDWNFTQSFKDAVESGKTFYMVDPESVILKRQSVTHNLISKNIELKEYYGPIDI